MAHGNRDCACHLGDEYDCWASRHGLRSSDMEEIQHDGGPCECSCHDEDDDLDS